MTRPKLLMIAVLVAAGGGAGLWFKDRLWTPQHPGALTTAESASSQPAGGRRGDAAVVAVVTEPARKADFPVRKHAIGFVETPASVVVKSRIDSQIMAQHIVDGQFVKAGDLLFTLDDRDIRAQIAKDEATIARDEATHTRNVADLSRYQQLVAKNAGTQQSVDQATGDERASAATILADKATLEADRLKLGYTRITSPIDGRVGAVLVTPGNLVAANGTGTGLVTITQMKPLRVSFTLPERDLPVLQTSLNAGKPLPVVAKVPDSGREPARGSLNFVDSSVDMASGSIVAKAGFANDDLALWPGQYVDVEVQADTLVNATVIATVAVQTGQKGAYVYVVKPDATVDLRPVTVALSDGARTAIRDGLSPGERVVTDGQLRLKPGVKVRERAGPDDAGKNGPARPGGETPPDVDVSVAAGGGRS